MRCSTLLMISLAPHLSGLPYDARSRRHRLLAAFNSLWASVDRRKLTVQLEMGAPAGNHGQPRPLSRPSAEMLA
jgi:hypothetical protein